MSSAVVSLPLWAALSNSLQHTGTWKSVWDPITLGKSSVVLCTAPSSQENWTGAVGLQGGAAGSWLLGLPWLLMFSAAFHLGPLTVPAHTRRAAAVLRSGAPGSKALDLGLVLETRSVGLLSCDREHRLAFCLEPLASISFVASTSLPAQPLAPG